MAIDCNQISQTANYLKTKFQDCKRLQAEDMQLFVDLVLAVGQCANGGANYNTLITQEYSPQTEDQTVNLLSNTYHSLNIMVLEGSITRTIDGMLVEFPTGSVLRHEVTTTNQYAYQFTVKAGAQVIVETLVETI